MADMQDFAGVVALAIKAAMAPVLERVALMESHVKAMEGFDQSVTALRERLVVVETKAANYVLQSTLTAWDGFSDRVAALESKSLGPVPALSDVTADLAAIASRLETLELRPAPSPVAPEVSAEDLRSVRDRLFQIENKSAGLELRLAAEFAKDLSTLRERVAVAEVRQPVPGPPGPAGKDGRDGADGLGFDDMAVEFDGERTLTIKAARGDRQKAWPFVLPYQYQRGVYIEGKTYGQGDLVTWAGSQWHANEETTARPGEGSKAWTLVVKRGRDGKDGKDAVTLPVVSLGGSRG